MEAAGDRWLSQQLSIAFAHFMIGAQNIPKHLPGWE